MPSRVQQISSPSRRDARLGERLRALRVSAGLTQSQLAAERFSKEYISQIERGKTRPTSETVEWLASQLGVDPGFIASGVAADERARLEAVLARAEALLEREDCEAAIEEFAKASRVCAATGAAELQVRLLAGEGWARVQRGEVRDGIALLERARALAEQPGVSDRERAEVVFRLAVGRYLISSFSTALGLFAEALALAERSPLPSDSMRASILLWRSRCYRRQRDYEAAREDAAEALGLAASLDDPRSIGEAFLEASLVAEREGHWIAARAYAERAKATFEGLSERLNAGRLLTNLGGLEFLLGRPEEALATLESARSLALRHGGNDDIATAASMLAEVELSAGSAEEAEKRAREALAQLGEREERLEAIGKARLLLGRALLAQGRLEDAEGALVQAEDALGQLSSGSQRASAWIVQGDLARARGDEERAAALYRQAAETLQDFRF